MYGILGESASDAMALTVLVKRIARDPRLTVRSKGYRCAGDLCNKGAAQLRDFARDGLTRFIVCHDADGPDPGPSHTRVLEKVVKPAGVPCCIVVPVEEIEAWILADLSAVTKVFTGWRPDSITAPERVKNPKEHLTRLALRHGRRYRPPLHNEQIARHIDLDVVARKCPSFRPLVAFVQRGDCAA